MPAEMPVSDLSRAMSMERETDWPDEIAIVVRRGKKQHSLTIPKDQFYGTGAYGAPITGQWLIAAIERLRKWKP